MEEPTAEPLQTVEATADYPIDETDENERTVLTLKQALCY